MPLELKPLDPKDAIAALGARGRDLAQSFHWQELYAADHARAFTVAKSAGYDILEDIYAGLETALAEGKTYAEFAKELTPLLQRKGWWGRTLLTDPQTGMPVLSELGSTRRLNLIFDANMRVSYAAGHWSSFERNKAARPYLRYVHLEGQENPRLQHKAWHNIVLPVDDPFWRTHACPNGWHCHCTLQSVSERDIDRLKSEGEQLRFKAPAVDYRDWTNKVTGETRQVPVGIDPGWDHNPGQAGAFALPDPPLPF